MLQRLSWSAAADGSQHKDSAHAAADLRRAIDLASEGLSVLRFDNVQVLKEIEGVMEAGQWQNRWRGIPPNPPLAKGGTDCDLQRGNRLLL